MSSFAASVKGLSEPVGYLGGNWMLHPEVLGPCRDVGYAHGYAYYVAGRGGVMGNVDADVITASFGFFEPKIVRAMWDIGVAVEGVRARRRVTARHAQHSVGYGSQASTARIVSTNLPSASRRARKSPACRYLLAGAVSRYPTMHWVAPTS